MNLKNKGESYFIYKIQSPSGKVYIGITYNIEKRFVEHQKPELKYNKILYKAILKYGWDSMKTEVIAQNLSTEQACEMEKSLILYYNCKVPNGYNMTPGGDRGVANHTQATKDKLSRISINLWENEDFKQIITSKRVKKIKSKSTIQGWKSGRYNKLKKKVLCVETGKIYQSMTKAEQVVGCRLDGPLYKGTKCEKNGYHYKYLTDQEYESIKPKKRTPLTPEEKKLKKKLRNQKQYLKNKERINKRNKDYWHSHLEEMAVMNKNRNADWKLHRKSTLMGKKCEICGEVNIDKLCYCKPSLSEKESRVYASDIKNKIKYEEFIQNCVIWCKSCMRRHYAKTSN